MYRHMFIAGLAIFATSAITGVAHAQDAPLIAVEDIQAPSASEPAIIALIVPENEAPESQTMLTDTDLSDLRGGDALVVGNQTLTAINNGTVLNGNYTAGGVSLTDNALSGFNGLGNLVINTGAQNNLQSAMNVTINFAQ